MIFVLKALVLESLFVVFLFKFTGALNSDYGYSCVEGFCQRKLIDNEANTLSLGECQLVCNEWASLWPRPTGQFSKGNTSRTLNPDKIFLQYKKGTPVDDLLNAVEKIFFGDIEHIIGSYPRPKLGAIAVINIEIQDPEVTTINFETVESYSLKINTSSGGVVQVFIEAPTYFGVRHGLQTLTQLIVYDTLRDQLKILDNVFIADGPAYPYRGLLLDTSRNYFTVDSIKRTLRGMSASKLNRFHWHLTDTQSFPYVSKSHPELSKLGAYDAHKVYTSNDIKDIVEYARVRGINVVPELDTPSHVGAGWERTGFSTCYQWQPWNVYCVEPPCGQIDPTVEGLYDFIEGLYGDLITDFEPDMIHFGGDEVSFTCWNSTSRIVEWLGNNSMDTSEESFIKLIQYYQKNALERLYKQASRRIPVIVWQSQMTRPEYIKESYDSNDVIVQIWANANYSQNSQILENNFKVILSNYDALYLDCGVGSWNTDGMANWCSPFKTWQMIYNNTPESIAGSRKNQVIGEEVALWTERVDSSSLDVRIWPRAAALAEVVWSEPTTDWKAAESRMLIHRERLVNIGISPEAMAPEWCTKREEVCRVDSHFNTISNDSSSLTSPPPPSPTPSNGRSFFRVIDLVVTACVIIFGILLFH